MAASIDCKDPAGDPRYSRQLPIIGARAQERLSRSRVAIVGLGGLGSIVSMYLAAAGVGELVIVDSDRVDWNNLNRQLLYDAASIGLPKAPLAARRLRMINPCSRISYSQERITRDNVHDVIGGADLIVDCLDNWETRLVLDWYAHQTDTPLLHAAVESYYGQLLLVKPGETACLHCIAPPREREGPIPVLGPAVGVVASLQALAAVRTLTGDPWPQPGILLLVDSKRGTIDSIPLDPRACECPGKQ